MCLQCYGKNICNAMERINKSGVKNRFLLRFKSDNIERLDQLFRLLIAEKHFNAVLLNTNIFKEENKAIYRVSISPSDLVEFKKRLDKLVHYKSFQVFEFKEW